MLAESKRCAYDKGFDIKTKWKFLVREVGDESICEELRSVGA
jgi:hypothetical protein